MCLLEFAVVYSEGEARAAGWDAVRRSLSGCMYNDLLAYHVPMCFSLVCIFKIPCNKEVIVFFFLFLDMVLRLASNSLPSCLSLEGLGNLAKHYYANYSLYFFFFETVTGPGWP